MCRFALAMCTKSKHKGSRFEPYITHYNALLARKGTESHPTTSTFAGNAQSHVSGFCYDRYRVFCSIFLLSCLQIFWEGDERSKIEEFPERAKYADEQFVHLFATFSSFSLLVTAQDQVIWRVLCPFLERRCIS